MCRRGEQVVAAVALSAGLLVAPIGVDPVANHAAVVGDAHADVAAGRVGCHCTASNPDRSRRLLFVGGRHRPRGLASRN
jgi:hypothetical protein